MKRARNGCRDRRLWFQRPSWLFGENGKVHWMPSQPVAPTTVTASFTTIDGEHKALPSEAILTNVHPISPLQRQTRIDHRRRRLIEDGKSFWSTPTDSAPVVVRVCFLSRFSLWLHQHENHPCTAGSRRHSPKSSSRCLLSSYPQTQMLKIRANVGSELKTSCTRRRTSRGLCEWCKRMKSSILVVLVGARKFDAECHIQWDAQTPEM